MSVSFRVRKEVCRVLLVGLASGLLLLSPAGTSTGSRSHGEIPLRQLRDKLKSEKAGDRRKAARELGQTLSREATPLLLGAVGDKDPEVRRAAIKSLGLIRDTERRHHAVDRSRRWGPRGAPGGRHRPGQPLYRDRTPAFS